MGGRRTGRACIVLRWTAGTLEKEQGGARGQGEVAISNERLLGARCGGRRGEARGRSKASSGERSASAGRMFGT